jgi:hypothetical protein
VVPGAEPLSGLVIEGSPYITKNHDGQLPAERRGPGI